MPPDDLAPSTPATTEPTPPFVLLPVTSDGELPSRPAGALWAAGEHRDPPGSGAAPPAGAAPAGPPGPPPSWAAWWRTARVDPGRRGVAALALVAVLVAGLTAYGLLRGRPEQVATPRQVTPPALASPATSAPAFSDPAASAQPAQVVVSVSGTVLRPGLVRLPGGSRVDDALRAAGGAAPGADLTGLNLARRLADGEQVVVGVPAAAQADGQGAGSSGATGPTASTGPVDLNTASATELDALPGIGPVLAQRIVDWRTEHGRFDSVDQLREVGGIGESKFSQVKSKVRV